MRTASPCNLPIRAAAAPALVLLLSGFAPAALAGVCIDNLSTPKVTQEALDYCQSQINVNLDAASNGLMLEIPNIGGCSLADFQFPGLGTIGGSISGSSCEILQSITSDIVSGVNEAAQEAADNAMQEITDTVPGMGSDGQVDIDLNDAANDAGLDDIIDSGN
jgi:hypothetical protein